MQVGTETSRRLSPGHLPADCFSPGIVCQSPLMKRVLDHVGQSASTDVTILILGETGTGKELVARAIYRMSRRRDKPLVIVNCAALPESLIESELFGHEKGAFTGASQKKIGRFELASGGTIFLDEIGDLPFSLQAKLLRVLQEGEFERLGSPNTINVDVRVIAATNCDLRREVREGQFREDLYYRLNVYPVQCPPLRDRKQDIPLLVNHFVSRYGARFGRDIKSIPPSVLDVLCAYDWPGNIRELENLIERAIIAGEGNELQLGEWFPFESHRDLESGMRDHELFAPRPLSQAIAELKKYYLERTLRVVGGVKKEAAAVLEIQPSYLSRLIRELDVSN